MSIHATSQSQKTSEEFPIGYRKEPAIASYTDNHVIQSQVPTLVTEISHILSNKKIEMIEELQNMLTLHDIRPSHNTHVENSFKHVAQAYQNAGQVLMDIPTLTTRQQGIVEATGAGLETLKNTIRNQRLQMQQANNVVQGALISAEKSDNDIHRITTGTSYAQIWARLAQSIATIKADYVDFYAELMHKYTEMYESFNENVQAASSKAVSSGDDGNNVKFDTASMDKGYNIFQNDVTKLNDALGRVPGWEQMDQEAKNSMVATLEPAYKIDKEGKISFNLDQYNSVKDNHPYPSGIKNGQISTASYQAWLATFNAAGNALQNNMQSFAQRYSQANSTFDNINKVLSGAISAMSDSAKEVLRAL